MNDLIDQLQRSNYIVAENARLRKQVKRLTDENAELKDWNSNLLRRLYVRLEKGARMPALVRPQAG